MKRPDGTEDQHAEAFRILALRLIFGVVWTGGRLKGVSTNSRMMNTTRQTGCSFPRNCTGEDRKSRPCLPPLTALQLAASRSWCLSDDAHGVNLLDRDGLYGYAFIDDHTHGADWQYPKAA